MHEDAANEKGYRNIAGVDEAGRGPLAGPVVAAACIIPSDVWIEGINESKKVTPNKREVLYEHITSHPDIKHGVGVVSSQEIDRINIYQATIVAMLQAVENLLSPPDYLLVDGLQLNHQKIPSQKIIRGDEQSHSIAAASILAKVIRDRLMMEYHKQWPQYGFDSHKGYGTKKHLAAIKNHGACPIHRLTFAPFKGTYE